MSLGISPLPTHYLDEQSPLSSWEEAQSQGIQWSSSNTSSMGLWYPKSSNHSNFHPAVTSLNCLDSSRSILLSQYNTSDFKGLKLNSKEPSPELTGFPCSFLNLQVKKSCNFLLNYKFDCCNWCFSLLSFSACLKKRMWLLRSWQQFRKQTSPSSRPDLPDQPGNSNIHILSFSVS